MIPDPTGVRVEEASVPARARGARRHGAAAGAVPRAGEPAALRHPLLHGQQGAGAQVPQHGMLHRTHRWEKKAVPHLERITHQFCLQLISPSIIQLPFKYMAY